MSLRSEPSIVLIAPHSAYMIAPSNSSPKSTGIDPPNMYLSAHWDRKRTLTCLRMHSLQASKEDNSQARGQGHMGKLCAGGCYLPLSLPSFSILWHSVLVLSASTGPMLLTIFNLLFFSSRAASLMTGLAPHHCDDERAGYTRRV